MDEVSVQISGAPDRVWALVTDVSQMGRWSPECTGGEWTHGAVGPVVGARFTGSNAHGWLRWRTHCQVVVAEPCVQFSFEVRESAMRWGYRLEPVADGTRLTEYRESIGRPPLAARIFTGLGLAGREREKQMVEGMRATLALMKAAVEAAAAAS